MDYTEMNHWQQQYLFFRNSRRAKHDPGWAQKYTRDAMKRAAEEKAERGIEMSNEIWDAALRSIKDER